MRDTEFLQAIGDLADTSRRDDAEVVTGQAIQLTRVLARRTPLAERGRRKGGKFFRFKNKGRARAGWWPAWKELGVFSVPKGVRSEVLARGEGDLIDKRHKAGNPSVTIINEVPYIDKLDNEHNILNGARDERLADMHAELERRYQRTLKRHSVK